MAELASGAVSSLLGLLRNEALLLSRVGSDSEFIKEEMESMHSFLEHLARTAPPAGGVDGHDEQVRTWMKQVRDLAHDCSNCIDLYIRRGDPAVYRARAGRWRYLWWASWLVQRMVAQHNAAIRLRDLKERARDVGNRRLRYGVEIPRKEASSLPSSSQAAATEDIAANAFDPRQRALQPCDLEEYCAEKLANWLELQAKTNKGESITSIAIVSPDDTEDAGAVVARDHLTLATANFTRKVWVNLSALHLPWDLPLLPTEILVYILHECEQQQGSRDQAYRYKTEHFDNIWRMTVREEIDKKIDEINNKVGEVDKRKIGGVDRKKVEENKCLGILLQALRLLQNVPDMGVPLSSEDAIVQTAYMLKTQMETGESKEPQIFLDVTQYKDVLHKVFPMNKPPQSQQVQEATTSAVTTSATALSEDHIKEIIHNHKITLDIISGLLSKPQLLEEGTSTKEQASAVAASVMKQDKENSEEISGEVTKDIAAADVASSAMKDAKEKTKEVSEEVTSAIAAAVIKETKEKMEASGEVTKDIAAALVKETKEKLKELSAEVTRDIAAAVIKETKEKMKEISGEVEVTNVADAAIKETMAKMYQVPWRFREQLIIKGIVDKIKPHLENKKTLIILHDDEDYVSAKDDEEDESLWEVTIKALNLLDCAPGSAVIVSTKNSQKAKEFCYPPGEPITCSLVGLYHDMVLEPTKQRMNNGNDGDIPKILHEILTECHPHEFCMKIFTYALYANPNRSYEELHKLHEDLIPHKTFGSKAKKTINFSYKDLPREHKTCLLYLAIFPQGHSIKRSTLIGRWVTEGLITKQDWATAVQHAEQCFDILIERGLILPHDIGAAGKVKSCMVGDEVHGFITKIANKEHILDARLSDLWARHFSIFSGLRLRASDGIDKFVHKLPRYSPQLPLLKVLDLEGTDCFDKSHYLKDICNKILLLKYLSLRGTNVANLPSEINNLHELEVLDIRQTMVPEHATRHVLLLKLRRFLANRVDSSSGLNDKSSRFAVQIPWKIEKMENLEVLSSAKASGDGRELKGISHLWQLRKLGVVIEDRDTHLKRLLGAIGDLKDCLQSLLITISSNTRTKSTLSRKERQPIGMHSWLRQTPKHLESLSINGVTQRGQLLELLAKGSDELAKVTLTGTLLKQDNLMVLSVLPKLHCVRLRSNAYNESKLTFKKEEFPQLKYFLVEGSNMIQTDIEFDDGATAELEKIVLSSTSIRSLRGIDNLPKLKELELEGNQFLFSFSQDKASPEQSTESRSPERNTESRALEYNTQSGSAEQNSEGRATERNTQSRAPEQNSESRAPEQNTESRAAEGITQSRDPEQSNKHKAPEQDSQSTDTKKNTEIRAGQNTESLDQNTESKAVEGNTRNTASEQNLKSGVPEQNTQSRAPEKNTESRVAEGITQSINPEQSNEPKAPKQVSQSTDPKQNTEIRAGQNTESPDQNTESKAVEKNTRNAASEQNLKSGVPEQNTQSRAPEKNTESRVAEGITQSSNPEQSNEPKAPEQDSQSTDPKQNTEIRAGQNTESLDQNTESKAVEKNTRNTASEQNLKSGVPEQNTQSRAPEKNTESRVAEGITQSRAPEQNSESRAPEQNTESRAAEGITQSRDPEQSNKHKAPEQDSQSTDTKKNTEIRAGQNTESLDQNTESKAVEGNTRNTASEQNLKSGVPEQNTQSRAPEKNTESRVAEGITQSIDPEQSNEPKAPEQDSQSTDPKQNTEIRAGQNTKSLDQSTENKAVDRNTRSTASEQSLKSGVLEQNTQSIAAAGITESRDPEQSNERKAPEQDSQSTDPKQNTEITAGQNTESRDPEQSNEHKAPEQDSQSTDPKQNTEITARQNTESLDQNTESKAVDGNTRSTASEQNLKTGVPEQNTQSRAPEQNTEGRAPEKNFESRFAFKKGKFQHLKYFRVEDSKMINITFESGAGPELKKIALSLTNKESELTGVSGLPKLKEIELKGDKFLLSLFDAAHQIAKVTLCDTKLKQGDIQILAKKRNLRCLELSHKSYDESYLAFNKDEFPKLDLLIVECPNISSISFTEGSAPKIEKIVWSFDEMKSLSDIDNLPRLKEIECKGDHVPHQVRKDIAAHKAQPVLTHKPQQQGQAKETSTAEEDDDTWCPPISRFLKIKNRR